MGRLRIGMLVAVVAAVLLTVFLIVELAGMPLLTDPRPVLAEVSVAAPRRPRFGFDAACGCPSFCVAARAPRPRAPNPIL